MTRIRCLLWLLPFLASFVAAHAQYIDGMPPAVLPVLPSDLVPICQGGTPGHPGTCVTRGAPIGDLIGTLVGSIPILATGTTDTVTLSSIAARVLSTVSVLEKGAKCDGVTDDSPAFTMAISAAGIAPVGGHNVLVPAPGASCVLKEGITLSNGVSLIGTAGAHWPGYDDNVEGDWTSYGSWIRCDDKVNACITVNGNGSTVDGLNFWYTQPTPPGTNCGVTCQFTHDWNPTVYPYTLSIQSPQAFNHFSNINIINATNCIDFEGPNTGVGSFFTQFDHMQLGCFNVGMKMNRIDNHFEMDHVDFLVLWYQAYNDVWGYLEGDTTVPGHKVDMQMSYVSDATFNSVQFYQSYDAINVSTGSVGSGLGTVTFGGQGLMFTNTNFNQVCQALTVGDANTILNADFTNTVINIDPQTSVISGQCGNATPNAFNLNSNYVDLSFTNINGFEAQTLFNVGGGSSGGVHLSGRVRISYSAFASNAPAIHVNTGAFADMANGVNNLFPVGSAGPQCTGACRNWPVVPLGDIWVAGAAGQTRQQLFLTTTSTGAFQTRWGVEADNTLEIGSNTGSNFGIARYNDDGSFKDFPMAISRLTGVPYFVNGIQLNTPYNCTDEPTGALWDNGGWPNFCGLSGVPFFANSVILTAPTSCSGQQVGTVYNNGGIPAFCGGQTGTPYFGGGIKATFPTSCSGQPTGTIWNNASTLGVCP